MTDTASKTKSLLPYITVAAICLAVGVYFGTQSQPRALNYESIQSDLKSALVLPIDFKTVPAFSLQKSADEAIQETALDGKWTIMIFGFTHCPDICPIALLTMKGVISKLEEEAIEIPQVAFLSVDPNRDTPELLSSYVTHFNDSFIPISGSLADITSLIKEIGVVASYTANDDDPTNYTVDHSTSKYLIDPQRRIRAKLDVPHTVENVLADYKTLMSAFNQD